MSTNIKKERTSKGKFSYSIGLDIGVSSVGWACLTPDYRIPKYNGRYAIGVREFESAQTAEHRRLKRGTRRRYNRRIKRIQLLQQTLSPLFQEDPGYFIEYEEKEKHFWRNNNNFENNSLSETLKYLGINSRKYPTIYHLRHALISEDKKFHPRLIYLALHNLVKYRGHFLNENLKWSEKESNETLSTLIENYLNEFLNYQYTENTLKYSDYDKLSKILLDNHMTNSDKRRNILDIVGKSLREPINLIVGLKTNVAKLFPDSYQVEVYKNEKVSLNFSLEENTEIIETLLEEEKQIVDKAHIVYQTIQLSELLGNSRYIAEAKVRDYAKFKEDTILLKETFNKYFGEKDFRQMFITSKTNQKKYKETRNKQLLCYFDRFLFIHDEEDKFYKDLLKKLLNLQKRVEPTEDRKLNDIILRLENDQFLRKLKSKDNSAIPFQNNIFEAECILINQQKYHPEITNSTIDKVKQIISFRIPYYIGPLIKNIEDSNFGWACRKKDNENITPWNFSDIVDESQSAESFISRMTSFCAYIRNQKVLPKHSITYQMFEVLNELNGLQIRSSYENPNKKFRLSKEEKEWLIDNVFKKYKNVTHKLIKQKLKTSPFKYLIIDENTGGVKQIYGTQKDNQFGTNLSSIIDMEKIFGDIDHNNYDMIEEIIYWITVFEEKDVIRTKIKEKYPVISDEQIKSLIRLNYRGWGRLSKQLIDELPADTNKHLTILDIMKNEPMVFMEVMAVDKYNLNSRIADLNHKNDSAYTMVKYKDVEELNGSPAIKKGIWQAILLIEELVDIYGEPENIMIEFAREEGEKRRTENRKNKLKELEKAISNDEKELKQFLKNHLGYKDIDYRDNRFFLYIIQQGKCLYSGETLHLDQLQNYEVDHILPRSFVKDDSLDNLALVKSKMNQKKEDIKMPLELLNSQQKLIQKMFWKKLYQNNLISQRKYSLLMKESFSDQDKEGFFARQLVETRQMTKHVKDLLNERFEYTEIHTVNANLVTNLRRHSQIPKLRNLNNKHHAIDAALTSLIIQFIINQYGANFLNFNFKYREAREKWNKMITKYRKNFFLFSDIDTYEEFIHYQTGEFITGREFLNILNDEIPWQTTKKVGTGESAFYDETIYSPKGKKGKKPLYSSSKLGLGVHSNVHRDSSYLISYKFIDNKNRQKVESKIIDLFIIEKYQTKNYTEEQLAFFLANKEAKGKVIEAKIHTKIFKHQLVLVDNHPFYFVSAGEMNNAKQFCPGKSVMKKIYKIQGQRESISKEYLFETFKEISQNAIEQYKVILPENRIEAIKEYSEKVKDIDTFNNGLNELLKMTSASAARSDIFGGRYVRRLNTHNAQFIYQSITGLRYRKPKSYRNELWSLK